VAGIVVKDGQVLLMHRFKNGEEHWVFPGGGQEEGETPEETVVREIEEETSMWGAVVYTRLGRYKRSSKTHGVSA